MEPPNAEQGRQILNRTFETKDWVFFEHGTYVVFEKDDALSKDDLIAKAVEILKTDGPVFPGSPQGDFTPMKLITSTPDNVDGMSENTEVHIVIYHLGEKMGTLVFCPKTPPVNSMVVGIFGRGNRQKDADTLVTVSTSKD